MSVRTRRLAGIVFALAVAGLVAVPAAATHDGTIPHAQITYWNIGADATLGGFDPHETTEDIDGVTGHVATPANPLTLVTSMENTGYGYCGPLYWNPATNDFKTYQVTGGFQASIDLNREAPAFDNGGRTFSPGDTWMTVNGNSAYGLYVNFRNSDNFRRYPFSYDQLGVRINQANGKVYTAGFYEGAIRELDPATNTVRTWSVGNRPYWLDLDSNGDVFTAAAAGGGHPDQIVRLTPSTGAVRRWNIPGAGLQGFVSFGMPNGIRIDPEGNLWVSQTGANIVSRLRIATNTFDQYTKPTSADPNGIAASGSGSKLQAFFTERNQNHLSLVTAATAAPVTVPVTPADSTVTPASIATAPVDFVVQPLRSTVPPVTFDSPGEGPESFLRFPAPAGVSGPAGISRVAAAGTIFGSFEGSDHVFRVECDCIVAPPAGKASAEAYSARARVEAIPLDTAKIGRSFSTLPDDDDRAILSESVPTVVDVGVGHATTETDEPSAAVFTAHGRHSVVEVDVANGTVTADVVTAEANATFDVAAGAGSADAIGSGFVNLEVAGTPVTDGIPANTTIPVPGVGTVVLNEQIATVDDRGASMQVNMIHFTSDDGSIEVVVSSAFAGAGTTDSPDDPPVRLPDLPDVPDTPTAIPPAECATGEPLLAEGFEEGLGSFTADNAAVWDAGAPTHSTGPGAAAEGSSVAGTLVGSSYAAFETGSLVSPVIDLTGFDPAAPGICSEKRAVVTFQSWYQSYYYDCGFIEASADGGATWSHVHPSPDYNWGYPYYCGGVVYPPDGGAFSAYGLGQWAPYEVDLTPFAGSPVQVRFTFGGYYPLYGNDDGWNVDDVRVAFQ